MSPDDDWALGQNEIDVRNEARRAANQAGVDTRPIPDADLLRARDFVREQGWAVSSVFACRNPEQAWIDESRAEAEREDTANEERTG